MSNLSGFTIPGGNSKDTPIEDATDRDLTYWAGRLASDIENNKSRNPGRDAPLRDAMRAELAKRAGGEPPVSGDGSGAPASNGPAQIQRVQPTQLEGTFREPSAATMALRQASEQYNLVSPATSVGQLPEGCAIALSLVHVDIENDTYAAGPGKLGLSKSTLQKIASALGISWEPQASGRVDDGSDPRYCRWKAVGTYRSFDGQVQTIVGEKEMDLRNGSPQVEGLERQQKAKGKDATAQISEMRLHIQQHAETKAQLRAIRSLGIKTGYTRSELLKPFVVARVMWTGQTDDPVLKRLFAEKTSDSFLGARKDLYGRQEHAPAGAYYSAPRLPSPPPVGSVTVGNDYDDDREMY